MSFNEESEDKKLNINSDKNNYDIFITKDSVSKLSEYISINYSNSKIVFIMDENVKRIYFEYLQRISKDISNKIFTYVIEPGENSKSLIVASDIYKFLSTNFIDRSDLIISFGGGVVGDLTGFISSTYKRGIDYIQLPTTLLAQIDSSIGGKVAVNIESGKNLVGSFYSPKLVIIDSLFLKTLLKDQILDGLGEIIKYGLIYSKEIFDILQKADSLENFMSNIDKVILMSCESKKYFVEIDEYDSGERMKLNFGHTIGHAIEKYYGYGKYSHGQAVAMGIYIISRVFYKNNIIQKELLEQITEIIQKYDMYKEDILNDYYKIIEFIYNDKKFFNGVLNLIYIDKIGKCKICKIERKNLKDFFNKI